LKNRTAQKSYIHSDGFPIYYIIIIIKYIYIVQDREEVNN